MLAAGLSWLVAAGMPVLILLMNLRDVRIGLRGLWLFQQDFLTSAAISAIVAGLTLLVAIGTVLLGKSSQKQGLTWLGGLFCLTAAIPAAALGIGFIVIFNRSGFVGDLYAKTATVWVLALVARFAVIPVVVTWLTVRRDPDEMIGQARLDGAGVSEILVNIMLLRAWPTLLASGLIVMLLSMFEVVITQLVRPAGFRSIAASLLNQMHYGRDDVVILISLAIVGVGVMMALACSWLLVPRGHRDT
jgi:iron(III) transport system permease protein